jgi:DNA repair exonuclease SbcCD nuclease subunit
MKFLHTSDFHAGSGRRLVKINKTDPLAYLKRTQWHWRKVVEIARERQVDFAIIAGDLFEDASTTIEELLALYSVLTEFGEVCPVIVTPGNHDETRVGEFQQSYLKLLGIKNIHVTMGKPESLTMPGNIRVLACPWTGIKKQDEFDAYLQEHYSGEEIVILHECFAKITTDTGWVAKLGVQIPDISGVKYFACGDIHKKQRLSLPHAWYSGAPGQWNFGDKPNKGVLIVDTDQYEWTPEFVPIRSEIELHQITDLSQIPEHSSHWYQFHVEPSAIPSFLPECVKDMDIKAAKIEAPVVMSTALEKDEITLSIDYSDGVDEILGAAGFDGALIQEIKTEIQRVTQ